MATAPTEDLYALLAHTAVFAHLGRRQLDAVLAETSRLWLPGGAPLYLRGEPSDALYIVISGSLGVYGVPRMGGAPRMLAVLPAGVTLGEVGLISGDAHSHSVCALRDSELLRLSREAFDKLAERHPLAMLGAARVAVRHLQNADKATQPRTFAILPFDAGVPAHAFAEVLQRNLAPWGGCTLIDAREGKGRDTAWFTARESGTRFVLYLADGDTRWQQLCRRQADALLMVVEAAQAPARWPLAPGPANRLGISPAAYLRDDPEAAHLRPRHLVLHHAPGRFVQGAARAWCRQLGGDDLRHHHWRRDDDIARLARLLAGRGTGLVLSGGGARGFAQIGVIQALRESGVTVDSVVGTSVGAIIGAGIASEWSDAELRRTCRRTMVDGKPLRDWTVPLVALTRGARTTELLRETFGEVDIEDLPVPFACVSADLTLGTTAVHRRGLLWRWLRASSAVPGVLPPLFRGGHVYVDGAVINNLPTDVMAEEGPGRLIAVDIGADDSLQADVDEPASPPLPTLWAERRLHRHRPGVVAILIRAGMVNSETGSARRRELADLLLRPDMQQIGMFEWHAFDRAIEIGYRHTREVLRGRSAGGATVPRSGLT